MRTNHVKQKLKEGESSIGTWFSLVDPFAAEKVAELDLDWIVVDTEHTSITIEKAALIFMAMSKYNIAPMVRIPWNNGENIKRALDAGAWGIVAPMIKTKQEAEEFVKMAKYPPIGHRSTGIGRFVNSFDTDRYTYLRQANDEVLLVAQIEHEEAIKNIDEIMQVEGIDACFIGPNDLMASMGLTEDMDKEKPIVEKAFQTVLKAGKEHNVPTGIHVGTADAINKRTKQGFQFMALSEASRLMMSKYKEEINKFKI